MWARKQRRGSAERAKAADRGRAKLGGRRTGKEEQGHARARPERGMRRAVGNRTASTVVRPPVERCRNVERKKKKKRKQEERPETDRRGRAGERGERGGDLDRGLTRGEAARLRRGFTPKMRRKGEWSLEPTKKQSGAKLASALEKKPCRDAQEKERETEKKGGEESGRGAQGANGKGWGCARGCGQPRALQLKAQG